MTKTCRKCGVDRTEDDFYVRDATCKECRREVRREAYHAKHRGSRLERYYSRRARAISHYGGVCECCAESRLEFLCLDHRDGGGNEHRRNVGQDIAAWAERNGYPAGLRVLCSNCNWATFKNGVCPHRTESPADLARTVAEVTARLAAALSTAQEAA